MRRQGRLLTPTSNALSRASTMHDDAQPSAPPIDLTQDVDSEEDDDEELPMFDLRAAVVGKQHYTGHMNEGEMVYLVREPRNPVNTGE
jgi:hypothetical protein